MSLPLGAHPGNTGGKKGRSGRKPKLFLAQCIAATEDMALWQAAREKNPLGTLDLAAAYAHGRPKQSVELSTPEPIRIMIVKE